MVFLSYAQEKIIVFITEILKDLFYFFILIYYFNCTYSDLTFLNPHQIFCTRLCKESRKVSGSLKKAMLCSDKAEATDFSKTTCLMWITVFLSVLLPHMVS